MGFGLNNLEFNVPWIQQTLLEQFLDFTALGFEGVGAQQGLLKGSLAIKRLLNLQGHNIAGPYGGAQSTRPQYSWLCSAPPKYKQCWNHDHHGHGPMLGMKKESGSAARVSSRWGAQGWHTLASRSKTVDTLQTASTRHSVTSLTSAEVPGYLQLCLLASR